MATGPTVRHFVRRFVRQFEHQNELKELIEFLIEKDIAEFELERGDVKVRIKRAGEHTVVHAHGEPRFFAVPPAPGPAPELGGMPVVSPPAAGPPAEPVPEEGLHMVKSPIVGTFYESPSPGSPPFVKAGDTVEVGQVLCIVEARSLLFPPAGPFPTPNAVKEC